MIYQDRDGFASPKPGCRQRLTNTHQSYYAAVPADLLDDGSTIIDQLISFAFDSLGATRLDVRVYDKTAARALVEAER